MNQKLRQLRQSLNRLTDRAGRIGRRSRPGSVLIIVVALLVLMAIIGTAYISSARTDRYSAAQNSFNTQIDLLVTGVLNQAIGLMSNPSYQAAAVYPNSNYYDDTTRDTWLAERCPVRLSDVAPTYDGNPATVYNQGQLVVGSDSNYYVCLLNGTTGVAPPNTANWYPTGWASTDIVWPAVSGVLASSIGFEDLRVPGQNLFQNRLWAKIISISIGSTNVPGLEFYDFTTSKMRDVQAGSATNDGIADSFLWRLPVGQLNGITYYTSVRIVDANSAVNVNTAMSRRLDFDYQGNGNGSPVFGFFTGDIGLGEMLRTWNRSGSTDATVSTELAALNAYRYNGVNPSGIINDSTSPYADPATSTAPPVARSDFKYVTRDDALMSGLGRRIDNPGYVNGTLKFQALSWPESAQMAYRGELRNPMATTSQLETALNNSLTTVLVSGVSKPAPTVAYDPSAFQTWFSLFYDFSAESETNPSGTFMNRRPLVVGRNPTNNYMPAHPLTGGAAVVAPTDNRADLTDFRMPSYDGSGSAPRCPLNTAKFGELWRGFWNAMYDAQIRTNDASGQNVRQLASSIRDPSVPPRTLGTPPTQFLITPDQMLLLRSGLAAINAMDLRDSDDDVTKVQIPISAYLGGSKTAQTVYANLYGTERQPYITEVYANNYTGPDQKAGASNPKGYVGIALYNPYNQDIALTNWQLGIVTNRLKSAPYTKLLMVPPTGFVSFTGMNVPTVPKHGYLILENYSKGGEANAALYRPYEQFATRPTSAGLTINYKFVQGLDDVMPADSSKSAELILLKPRVANGTVQADETTNYNLVPVDSFDFTGQVQAPANSTIFRAIHYARPSGQSSPNAWQFVYPGRYDPSKNDLRQEGTLPDEWDTNKVQVDPWETASPTPNVNMGVVDNSQATYSDPFAPIQLCNTDWGLSKLLTTNSMRLQMFPFGGFARDADVLQAPFMGAYSISTDVAGQNVLELNSVSMDCQLTDDNDATDDQYEQIGRFCPIASTAPAYFMMLPANSIDWYGWAENILAYFTIQSPTNDFLPNVPLPTQTPAASYYLYNPGTMAYDTTNYPTAPESVLNRAGTTPNMPYEDLVPIEGRININTASWRVLSTLPFYPAFPDLNPVVARTIVKYRLAHGPYKSVLDLNRAYDGTSYLAFQKVAGDPATTDFGALAGDPSPTTGSDGVMGDFEKRFNTLAHVSNLITTRSDTFTIYVQVQGYRGIGTATPELVVQRHAAVIVDRSQITANNKSAVVQHSVPTN